MVRQRVLLKVKDARIIDVVNSLKSEGIECDSTLDLNTCDLLLTDSELIQTIPRNILKANAKKIIIITENQSLDNVREYLVHCGIHHIIGGNSKHIDAEVKRTLRKFLTAKYFGIEQYLGSNQYKTSAILGTVGLEETIEKMINDLNVATFFDSPVTFIKTVCHELLSNAIYNAPLDKNGNPKYRTRARTEEITLEANEQVCFKVGTFDQNIVISVTDNFGGLNLPLITENLKRSFEIKKPSEKEGGAGLGLYLIYSHCNEVIFNCHPGKKSEVIVIFENTKRYKEFRSRITSFHYFEGVNA